MKKMMLPGMTIYTFTLLSTLYDNRGIGELCNRSFN